MAPRYPIYNAEGLRIPYVMLNYSTSLLDAEELRIPFPMLNYSASSKMPKDSAYPILCWTIPHLVQGFYILLDPEVTSTCRWLHDIPCRRFPLFTNSNQVDSGIIFFGVHRRDDGGTMSHPWDVERSITLGNTLNRPLFLELLALSLLLDTGYHFYWDKNFIISIPSTSFVHSGHLPSMGFSSLLETTYYRSSMIDKNDDSYVSKRKGECF